MKKQLIAAILTLSMLTLAACANNDDENTSENTNREQESQEAASMSNDDMLKRMKELDYSIVDFDVFYEDTEFEGEIKVHDGIVESEFYNTFENIDKRGAAAFDAIFPFIQKLDVTKDMSDEEAINVALKTFDLPDKYLKAELRIIFPDGTDKEFEVNLNEM